VRAGEEQSEEDHAHEGAGHNRLQGGQAQGLEFGHGRGFGQATMLNEGLFVLERDCSCCGWELDKGDLCGLAAADPAVACCLCGQTYSLVNSEPGGDMERKGMSGWVAGLVRCAPTMGKAMTQFAIRADIRDGDMYLDLGSQVFAKAAKSKPQIILQSD